MASSPLSEIAPFGRDRDGISVLLVDDDEAMVEMSAAFLKRELPSVETTAVTDPEVALERLSEGEYDCIISDFDMPGMDGLELLVRVRELDSELPFVLFTGKGSEEIASQAITAGVDEYLQKGGPEEYPVLANKVEILVEKYWAEEQVRRGFSAIESAEEGIGIIDQDGVYRYMNRAYATVYNRDRSELIGEHWEVLYSTEEATRFHDEILPQLEAEGTWRGVSTGLTSEGDPIRERLVLTQMDDGGHVCIVQAIEETDEIEAELALKNRALDAAHAGVIITGPARDDTPIVYLNERFEELTGYDGADVLGRNCRFLQGEDTDTETVAEIRDAVRRGVPISTEILNYDAEGTPFWNRLEIAPIRDVDGRVTNFVGFQREIPGPDAADSAEAQFDWLGDFGSVLSHDLKTPLAVLKGNLDLIEETGDLDYLDAAIDATNRIESLVDDLANVMTQRNLVCDVTTVELADAFRSWDVLGGDRASFEVVDSKPILADERALARLADNLVKNTVEHAGPDVPMRIGTLPDGFYYEDAGPGIPPENRADAFEPGFSTKADGTGFGMVSVEQIAAAHGWDVSIAESPEGGARFEFTGVEDPTEESVRR